MAWLVVAGVVVVVVGLWRLGRPPSTEQHGTAAGYGHLPGGTAPAALAPDATPRAVAPDEPAAAFMDGYVSGRYAHRHDLGRASPVAAPPDCSAARLPPGDDTGDETGNETEVDTAVDTGAVPHDVHHDVHHDPFDDDSSDDW